MVAFDTYWNNVLKKGNRCELFMQPDQSTGPNVAPLLLDLIL